MKNQRLILLFILILAVIGISGFIYLNINSQKSFSDGSITFNYPGSFQESISPQIIKAEGWIHLITLNDYTTIIYVQKNQNITKIDDAQKSFENAFISSGYNGEILSNTEETNSNGVEISISIYTITDPNNNEKLKYVYFYFKDRKGSVYNIIVYDYELNFNKVSRVSDVIFNSLRVI